MQSTRFRFLGSFLFQWTFINLLGAIVGVVVLVIMYALLPSSISKGPSPVFDQGISVVIMGLLLGLFQWFVLKSKIDQSKSWIPATAIGLVIGVAGFAFVRHGLIKDDSRLISSGLGGMGIGALLGTAQWTVLRKQIRSSLFWILGSAAGWGLGAAAIMGLGVKYTATNVFQEFLFGAFVVFIAIGIYSIMTGCTFLWLVRSRQDHQSSTISSEAST